MKKRTVCTSTTPLNGQRELKLAAIIACLTVPYIPSAVGQQAVEIQGDEVGFVVHEWGTAGTFGPAPCPDGRSLGYRQIFERSPEAQRRQGEPEGEYGKRLEAGGVQLAMLDGQSLCANPELAPDDPHFRVMSDTSVPSYGIALSESADAGRKGGESGAPPATCEQADFPAMSGTGRVNNQYLRLTGCTGLPSLEPDQAQPDWLPPPQVAQENTMLEGGWGVLIALRGVDSLENDDNVSVGIYANADPIVLSGTREPVPFVTYAADQNPRFRGETRGRIVDGVLMTEPVDVRFHWLAAGMHLERPLSHARLEARFKADGTIEGYLAGYTPVEALYDMQYGFRNARDDAGDPISPQFTSRLATLSASAIGRTCNGAYGAMYRLADGDRDPETGRCRSLSTQYYFRATPAFIVDVESAGINESLLGR